MITSGFFESILHDRVYTAEDFGNILDPILTDGLLYYYRERLQVTLPVTILDNMLQVSVKPGVAWYKNKFINVDSEEIIQLDESPAYNQRWDAIVLDFDLREETRMYSIKYIKGTAEKETLDKSTGRPIYIMYLPDLVREENHMQVPLAYILIKKNITKLDTSYIVDRANTNDTDYIEYKLNEITYRLKTKGKDGTIKPVYGCPIVKVKEPTFQLYGSFGYNYKYIYFMEEEPEVEQMLKLKLNTETDEMIFTDDTDPKYIDISHETMFAIYEEVE